MCPALGTDFLRASSLAVRTDVSRDAKRRYSVVDGGGVYSFECFDNEAALSACESHFPAARTRNEFHLIDTPYPGKCNACEKNTVRAR